MKRPTYKYQTLKETDKNKSENSSESEDYVDYVNGSDGTTGVQIQNGGRSMGQPRRKKNFNWIPEQFKLPARNIPWKSIGYAVFLFVLGMILLLCGCLIHTGHVDNEKYGDRLWPLIIFGLLMFIPGSYHVYIVVNVFMGTPGYSFEEFPQFED